ncbi:Fe(3+) ABC transporter substrate-binding protein [Alkaliphilus hydrothermalis]|uniref:Iron(III) transport system substrate-binding protein n=1 Tax=Alkaliphilus hydrothermalis TaxID=1482730 RepID=A0ABS2NND2_9FIRM|nr:Fe(3+) ABC transporter substrate-binding protein [Alkaliphilus hydrothermalis]MBM7614453.1 iron(III) transport system substrate-binding protein [Alkaliphilus hydrothermalis]
MKKGFSRITISLLLVVVLTVLAGCSTTTTGDTTNNGGEQDNNVEQVVNLYSDRHYDTDEELYAAFTEETGIKVNVVNAKSDELIERLKREGQDTEADLLITADAGRLWRAKEDGLLQAASNDTLTANIPENLRDPENYWYGLTVRARVIVYAKDRVQPSELSTYEDLTSDKWMNRILVRSSSNIYNQSLMASFIDIYGEEYAKNWAEGVLANMAREPQGGDTDQAVAVAAGEGDIAISNTYYIGRLMGSSNPEEKKIGESLGIFFPDQNEAGTHINVSGIGLTAAAKNKENAIKFMEFLTSEKAQKQFSEGNYEYPANANVEATDLLKSWGEFKTQNINLAKLGEFNAQATKVFDQVGWK